MRCMVFMRRLAGILLSMAIVLYTGGAGAKADDEKAIPPAVQAEACALIEASTGRVLYQQQGDVSLPMASTTKVMTALVVLERAELSDVVEIPKAASGIEGTSIYLETGEKLTVEQLLYGLLMKSGNDAATALAIYVGGSVEGFVEMMNDKATDLGLSGTHFQNPHGLPADGHVTTALDLSRIMANALRIPKFREILATPKIQIPWDGHPWNRVLTSKNQLLSSMEGCLGGKTGYTKAAGRCLVEACERDGMELISVVLNCPDWWNQTEDLLEYGFAEYRMVTLAQPGEVIATVQTGGVPGTLEVQAREALSVPAASDEHPVLRFEMPQTPDLPVDAGRDIAMAVAEINGQPIWQISLCAGQTVQANRYGDIIGRIFHRWPAWS